MTKNKKIIIFSASALLLAVLALLCFFALSPSKKPDKNGMFKIDGMWFEAQKEITPKAAQKLAEKIITLKETFLTPENRVFFAAVPDKSYYITEQGYTRPDYEAALLVIQSTLGAVDGIEQIDLTDVLGLNYYYVTDSHWRQECLDGVLSALGNKMGFSIDLEAFETRSHESFIGSYGKNLSKSQSAETLFWLTNDEIENAQCLVFTTKDYEKMPVYHEDKLIGKVPYDLFLYGSSPLVKIQNPAAKSDRELVIFRDSYASSLTPLLIGEYKNITLIDLRYMASQVLTDYVQFDNQDVLFLYSTAIMADSAILR